MARCSVAPAGEIEIAGRRDAHLQRPARPVRRSLGGVVAGGGGARPYDGDVADFALTLRDLQLPAARPSPRRSSSTWRIPDELAPRVLDLVAGLVRAQAATLDLEQPALRPFAALAGMLGLRPVDHVPAFPFADLPTRGAAALVAWVQQVLGDPTARNAWLGQLADLLGGTVDTARDAVVVPLGAPVGVGSVEVAVGLRVGAGSGGHPVLVPWAEVALTSRAGVRARAAVDLLSLDTGTGSCVAVPDARVEAVFGADAGGGGLVDDAPQLAVDSLHVGLRLDAARRPAFLLTARGVTVAGRPRDLVDLSSPDAALAAGADLVTGALTSALDALGESGDLVGRLLGVLATGGVGPVGVPALVADPVATVRGHWRSVLADAAASADLLGRLSALLRGAAAQVAPGDGSQAHPWRVAFADTAGLDVWHAGELLHVALASDVRVTVLGGLVSTTTLSLGLADVDLAGGSVRFATGASLATALARVDDAPMRLGVGPVTLEAADLALEAVWLPSAGLRVQLVSDGLVLDVEGVRTAVPLPVLDAQGRLTLPAPDWAGVEAALAALVEHVGAPELGAALALLGWSGQGGRLPLAALLGPDPATAVRTWLADLLLDCDTVRSALGPVAALLSGFALSAPTGSGNADDPFRAPVAGAPRAPGIRVWADPGCAVPSGVVDVATGRLLGSPPPEPDTVVDVLRAAALRLPEVAELLVGRDSLADGLGLLADRWTQTDGLVGTPATLPPDVGSLELAGLSQPEIAALGRSGLLLPQVTGPEPVGVVHVGSGPEMLVGRPSGSTYDLTGSDPLPTVPDGDGPFFVRLPTPADAAAARPDRGDVGEQAARLVGALGGRSGSLALVGYGAAGAAALRAAAELPEVSDVVTVGTPWAPTSCLVFSAGLGADALQLLGRLQRDDVPDWPDPLLGGQATPLQRTRLLVQRSLAAWRGEEILPRADLETRRAGLAVHAVFGSLGRDDLLAGLGAFGADAVDSRLAALTGPADGGPGAVTAVHAAVDLPVLDLDLGGLLVGAGAALELCRLSRDPDGTGLAVEAVRSLVVEVRLGVHDGWLVGGPGSSGSTGDLRWLSARVEVPLDGSEGGSELVLHEARGLGVDRVRWVVRAGADGDTATVAVPEVRVLLGDLVTRLRAASADLADLLGGLGPQRRDRRARPRLGRPAAARPRRPAALPGRGGTRRGRRSAAGHGARVHGQLHRRLGGRPGDA